MKVRRCTKWLGLVVILAISFVPELSALARFGSLPTSPSAYDVIQAVNALRAQHGLSAYSENSILMGTAQAQANYMASVGTWTHTGRGGSTVTQRLLNAGYPLAGDLSLGGLRSENVVMGPGMTAAEAVAAWTTDSIHLHTMLSTDLENIGAGVADSGGTFYYVIDCARPLGSGDLAVTTPGAEAVYSAGLNEIIIPVAVSTPDAKGQVLHEVRSGQSLWQIANSYGVKVADIRKLNQLPTAYLIQPGDKLVVKLVPTSARTVAAPTAESTPSVSVATSTPMMGATDATTSIPTVMTALVAPPPGIGGASGAAVGAIIVTALVAAGLVAWAGRSRPI